MNLSTLLEPREKFLILELTPSGTNGLFLSVDEEKNLIFEKFARNINLKKFLKSPVRNITQRSWEGNYFFKSRRKVIVSADSSIATTIPIPLVLTREHEVVKQTITLPELENLIAQGMAKIFNQCRGEAARRLAIHEIDTILVGAKAKHFKVDGNSVVNPAGFSGKKITLLLELTFTSRQIFEDLKQFFNSPEDFFFAESAQARLFSLSRAHKLPLNLVVADHGRTSLFVLQKAKDEYPVLYREQLAWSFETLFQRIAGDLGTTGAGARLLYQLYREGGMSESAARAFKKIIDPVIDDFMKEIQKGKLGGLVYIDAPYLSPFDLPHRHAGATFDEFPMAEILLQLGFGAEIMNHGESAAVMSRHLLPFLEAYFDKTNSDINQKLRRRLHWLAE